MGEYNPAHAKALLDSFGYIDRDGDGWREMPDGSPLTLEMATQPDQLSRQLDEIWRKSMTAVNINIAFKPAKWPENLKNSRAGKLMMWRVGWVAAQPDGDTISRARQQLEYRTSKSCALQSSRIQQAVRAAKDAA